MHTDDTHHDELPETLQQALRELQPPVPDITSRADREIAALASAHFATRKPKARSLYPLWAAAAAVGVIAIGLTVNLQEPPTAQLYTDVDGSGQIDIADVFVLAKEGGAFTQEELDAFAMSIVMLDASGDAS